MIKRQVEEAIAIKKVSNCLTQLDLSFAVMYNLYSEKTQTHMIQPIIMSAHFVT